MSVLNCLRDSGYIVYYHRSKYLKFSSENGDIYLRECIHYPNTCQLWSPMVGSSHTQVEYVNHDNLITKLDQYGAKK